MIKIDIQKELDAHYNITNHAYERYAERMTGRDNPTDIRTYINLHKHDIEERINKLINYGKLIYEGKLRDYPVNKIYFNDSWVVVVDPKTRNVITLYKIDFGIESVNKLFIDEMLLKIESLNKELLDVKNNVCETNNEITKTIQSNEDEIKYYKSMIKSLEITNESLNTVIKESNVKIKQKEKEMSDLIDLFVSRKKF